MRRAIAQSIDRRRLSDAITRGQYPVTDSDQPPFSWAYDPTARLPGYDPTAADRALDMLGWKRQADGVRAKDGRRLEIVFAVFPEGDTAVRTAVYVQQMLAARGIDVTIKKVTLAQFYLPAALGGLLMSGKYDVAYFAWRTGEDPDDSDLVTCSGVSNYAGYCSSTLDALELRALATPDQSRRRALYSQIQQTLARDIPYLYLYAPTYGYAVENQLHGFEPTPFSPTSDSWRWQR
jgi:peptide/nickel transport system substrate-binding protein